MVIVFMSIIAQCLQPKLFLGAFGSPPFFPSARTTLASLVVNCRKQMMDWVIYSSAIQTLCSNLIVTYRFLLSFILFFKKNCVSCLLHRYLAKTTHHLFTFSIVSPFSLLWTPFLPQLSFLLCQSVSVSCLLHCLEE